MAIVTRSDVASAARGALERVANGRLRVLPFTLKFWDGSTLPGESPSPVTVVRSPQALVYLLRAPNQVGLARAWVTGTLDVEGDIEKLLAARDRFHGVALSSADRAKLAWATVRAAPSVLFQRPRSRRSRPPPGDGATRSGATVWPSATTTTSRTTSTGRCSGRA